MSRRLHVRRLAFILLLCPLIGCGGSSRSASTSATRSSPGTVTPPVATEQPAAPTPPTGTAGSPNPAQGGARNARLPATFTIGPGGALTPPTVSSPAFLAIQLTVVSGDGKPHRVVLRTPTPHALSVPAGGKASTLIGGLKAGRYPIEVDGKAQGALVSGGEPGP